MKHFILIGGMAAALLTTQFPGFNPAAEAGWGPPFACGAGPKTGEINWDPAIPDPAPKPVITGITAAKSDSSADEEEWTIEELKEGKPLFIYYFVQGMEDPTDDNYKLSRKLEMMTFNEEDIIKRLNESWRAKKVGLDLEEDLTEDKNQARVEFWSFTKVKMGTITVKQDKFLKSRLFLAKLKKYEKENRKYCDKEVKRLEDIAKEEAKKEVADSYEE